MARGSIVRRGERLYVVVEMPRGEDGRRRQKWHAVPGSTQREAEKLLAKLQHEANSGGAAADGASTLSEYLARWLEDSAAVTLAPQSLYSYRAAARYWQKTGMAATRLDRLSPLQVQRACREMAQRYAPATVHRYHTVLHRALREAVEWGLISRNPAHNIRLPKAERYEGKALTAEKAIALLQAARQDPCGIAIVLALGLGLRLGECLGLQWRDVDWKASTVTVRRSMDQKSHALKPPKSGQARLVSLPQFVRLALDEELLRQSGKRETEPAWNPDGLVFVGPEGRLRQVNSTPIIQRISKAAGLPAVRFHDLRHTHATLLIASGEDVRAVSERMGHADIRITLQVYHHVLPGVQEAVAKRLDGMLG